MLGRCNVWKTFLATFSTLPLSEEGILSQPHLISELFKLFSAQCLGKNVCHLLVSVYVVKPHDSSLYTIPDEVIPDVNVLAMIMKHQILRELDATLIVTVNHSSFYLLPEQTQE
jgi:hypothetical protein